MTLIAQGAEAVIRKDSWHSRPAVVKERVPKAYRARELDSRLRSARTRSEAQLMAWARKAGVMTPLIFDVDITSCSITMEFVEGPTAKTVLQDSPDRMDMASIIGSRVGRLHRADIIHGDLTTSNMIFRGREPCFIDFGLGERSPEPEKKGVDLHLLKEALSSAHSEHGGLFAAVTEGYASEYQEGGQILKLVGEIEQRGRYH